ncbi:accessory gene regulator B family protein [Alkaliphilus sp. MSJ-5]|uniref:Accessory gene regulator B family protein n=1 Tax=Alkaliphilus flagellatus TaxID=2841507 RepID=A0ABS6FXR6_9FIRM|nr:accessory gene regulator B family protein [Alkaliphilus flagellatus]MBU5675012.1 accessory gene regulator B family protein [Alkaliphilus flagellatus]
MHSLIDLFAYKVYKEKILPKSDILKMKYAMNVIWNEIIKFALLMIIFGLLNKLNLFLFCTTLLLPIRIFSGGVHFKRRIPCFIGSLSCFALAILIFPSILNMTVKMAVILMLISIIIVYIYSPISSSFRPILNEKRKRVLNYLSVFFTLICVFILFKFALLYNKAFFECGIWTISLQAFQLIIGKELR